MDMEVSVLSVDIGFSLDILAGSIAASSIKMYRRDFTVYLTFATSKEQALKPRTLARWRASLANETTLSPNTINRMLSAVKSVMRQAAEQDYIANELAEAFKRIPGVRVVALKERTKDNARIRIDTDTMRKIANTPNAATLSGLRDKALLLTLASAGIRVSELTSLKQTQVIKRGSGYQLSIRGKNDEKFRDAPLSPEAFHAIEAWLAVRPTNSEYIFTCFDGRGDTRLSIEPLSENAVWEMVKKYATDCGIHDVKPHDFRRFVGTQLAQKNLRQAQKALGHKRIDTTVNNYVLDDLEVGITDNLF